MDPASDHLNIDSDPRKLPNPYIQAKISSILKRISNDNYAWFKVQVYSHESIYFHDLNQTFKTIWSIANSSNSTLEKLRYIANRRNRSPLILLTRILCSSKQLTTTCSRFTFWSLTATCISNIPMALLVPTLSNAVMTLSEGWSSSLWKQLFSALILKALFLEYRYGFPNAHLNPVTCKISDLISSRLDPNFTNSLFHSWKTRHQSPFL